MVPIPPSAAFEVAQAQNLFQLAVVVFDAPAHLRPPDEFLDQCGGRQVGHPVAGRIGGFFGLFYQEP